MRATYGRLEMNVDVTRADSREPGHLRDAASRLSAGGDEYRCGKLQKAMHSTRDAAQNWQRKCAETAHALGFA